MFLLPYYFIRKDTAALEEIEGKCNSNFFPSISFDTSPNFFLNLAYKARIYTAAKASNVLWTQKTYYHFFFFSNRCFFI